MSPFAPYVLLICKFNNIKVSYLEEEAEADPLVVLDVLLIPLVPGLVDPGVRHVDPDPLPVRRGQGVGGVDPAVGV